MTHAHAHTLQIGCAALVESPRASTEVIVDRNCQPDVRVTVIRHVLDLAEAPVVNTVLFTPATTSWAYRAQQWKPCTAPAPASACGDSHPGPSTVGPI